MKKATLNVRRLLLAFMFCPVILSACSIDISTKLPATPPAAPSSEPPSTAPSSTQPASAVVQPTLTTLPVTWADLHLTGKLVYTAVVLIGDNSYIDVDSLDLSTGEATPIFRTPTVGWVDSAAVSPDGSQMVLSYVPPVGSPHGGQETVYILPADGSKLAQLLFTPADTNDQNTQVVWSPDGKYVYFAHTNYQHGGPPEIWRAAYPNGEPEKVLDNAYWPRLSDDSQQLTYVTLDLQTGANYLFVANSDGSQARQVPVKGPYLSAVIDVPMFSPDGQSILFSAQDPPQSFILKGLDTLLTAALVHPADGSIPSDWWSVPIAGGTPKQLTHLGALSLYGGYSPDRQHIVSYSTNGIFVMNPDGTAVTMIIPDIGGIPGTVTWVP